MCQLFRNFSNGANCARDHTLNLYINGTDLSSGINYRDVIFHAQGIIIIVYGKSSATIPTKYNFGSL